MHIRTNLRKWGFGNRLVEIYNYAECSNHLGTIQIASWEKSKGKRTYRITLLSVGITHTWNKKKCRWVKHKKNFRSFEVTALVENLPEIITYGEGSEFPQFEVFIDFAVASFNIYRMDAEFPTEPTYLIFPFRGKTVID